MTLLDDVKNAAMKYAQLYNPIKKTEKFEEDSEVNEAKTGLYSTMTSIFWLIVVVFAIYLSFKKNNGFNILGFLAAFFFAPIYIIYVVATTGLMFIPIVGSKSASAPIS